jgi:hypothetical protein
MANFFDQYDEQPAQPARAKANFFDRYDDEGSSIPAAIRDIPSEIGKAAGNAIDAMARTADRGKQGGIEGLLTTGRAALAVPELLMSPVTGAARSLIGHPLADLETGLGQFINPEVAKRRRESGQAYEDAKEAVDKALAAVGPRGGAPAAVPAAAVTEGQRVTEAARRVSDAVGREVNVPRAIASDSMAVQRIGQGVRNMPVVGDAIPKATNRMVEDLGAAVGDVADQYGFGNGSNVAHRIKQTIRDAAESETQAAANAALRSDEAATAAWQRDVDAAHRDVAGRERTSLEAVREAVGDMSPQDMGAALIDRLRAEERTARGTKDALYERAGRSDASIRVDAVESARPTVVGALERDGVVVDPQLTPAANRMLDELQRLSQLNIPNQAQIARPGAPGDRRIGVSVQGIEQARKRLVSLRQAANNDADRRAARLVMEQFDQWQSNAFENALLSGDDAALRVFREARAANTSWRNRFFNDDDDAGRIVTRIVTGEVTPQEVANYIIGAGKVGAKGVSSRLLTSIAEATGGDTEAMQAIRGGIWSKLSQTIEGAEPKQGSKVAADIVEFLYNSGRDVAQRLFTPEQQRLMRAYADTLRNGEEARQLIGEVAATTKPGAVPVPPGPMRQLAEAVIGRGEKSDEAVFHAIDAYARSGSRGDVATLAKLVRALPQQDRGDLAAAIVRNLGISARTGEFSPDVFVSQWKTYTPQAKAILFGNAGPHRQALDDIALISDRFKQVGSRFGNPSGTAQNRNFGGAVAAVSAAAARAVGGDFVSPLVLLASGLGGWRVAKILAAPAGAASAAKWVKAYAAFRAQPTRAIGAFQTASRNLANTAEGLGMKVSADAIQRMVAPSPSQQQTAN